MQMNEYALTELLASIAHDQWSTWMQYMFTFINRMDSEKYKKWKRQMVTPYEKLSESEKDVYLHNARNVVDEIRKHIKLEKQRGPTF